MNIIKRIAKLPKALLAKQILTSVALLALLFATWPQNLAAYQQEGQAPQDQAAQPPAQDQAAQTPYTTQTPEQLQQLVAPIALYPDSLIAQVLAASTFPDQVVEADRWVQANPDLKGDDLAKAVDQQNWDPSVKALTAFPSVLGNMDKNLSWTSSLGDAYANQQQDVTNAVQSMRQQARKAGHLDSNEQEKVTTQGNTIVIEPSNPDVVYVPAYDPWLVYGYPVAPWPGWYPYPGIWFGGPFVSFGLGFGIGFYGGFGWGWGHWGCNWHGGYVAYNHGRYYSRSNTFYNRNNYYRGGGQRGVASNVQHGMNNTRSGAGSGRAYAGNRGATGNRGGVYNRPGATPRPFSGNQQAARGYASPNGQAGTRSGAFSNYNHGGQTRSFSSRGSASMGAPRGGAAPHGGGGGAPHGGGGGGHHK